MKLGRIGGGLDSQREIHSVKWFSSGEVMRLLDDGDYLLWGDNYTYLFLQEWINLLGRTSSLPLEDRVRKILELFPGMIGMEVGQGAGPGIYRQLRQSGELDLL